MNENFIYKVNNNFPALQELMNKLALYLKNISIPISSSRKVRLVIEELISNIIKYGYEPNSENIIEILIHQNKKSLRIEITDNARPFDPTAVRGKKVIEKIENLKIGGLGLIIVKESCSRMKYKRQNGINYLSITRRCSFDKNKNIKGA